MSYRIQIELDEHAPLKKKVELHAKFLRHLQRRKLDADHKGKTNWKMEYVSGRGHFTIIWSRESSKPRELLVSAAEKYHRERRIGMVVLKFSDKDVEIGSGFIVTGDWTSIEDRILTRERVA